MFQTFREIDEFLKKLVDLETQPVRDKKLLSLEQFKNFFQSIYGEQYPIPVIQIVGSKGKGSTAFFLEFFLRSKGLRTGLYHSPHLFSRKERILIDGKEVSDEDWGSLLTPLLEQMKTRKISLTRFEVETALALDIFKNNDVDVVILEAGMGGGEDATRVVHPQMLLLTSVELEHTEHLGNNLLAITQAKVGILPKTTFFVTTSLLDAKILHFLKQYFPPSQRFFLEDWSALSSLAAHQKGMTFQLDSYFFDDKKSSLVHLPFYGLHQARNYALAFLAAQLFLQYFWNITLRYPPVFSPHINHSLQARMQLLRTKKGTLFVDVAHTPQSIAANIDSYKVHFEQQPPYLLLSVNRDKDILSIIKSLKDKVDKILLVKHQEIRAYDVRKLSPKILPSHVEIMESLEEAERTIFQYLNSDRPLIVTGSFAIARWALRREFLSNIID